MESSRQTHVSAARSLVIKLGTQLLADAAGEIDPAFLGSIAAQVARLRERGMRVTLVSSGAIAAGLRELRLPARPTDLGKLQAVAAVGQRRLMDGWAAAFGVHGLPVGQILLTRDDIDERVRFLNLRNTIASLHEMGAIPVINENDTISTDELSQISFGDNDILAAIVAQALRADLLVLLSVVDGILDAAGQPQRLIEQVTNARSLVRAEKSSLGKGGFNSKLEAARMVTDSGEAMVVANGRTSDVLLRLIAGEDLGTLFVPAGPKRSSRSRWIGSVRPSGQITVDEGAAKAVGQDRKSLLPAGIVGVSGDFERGEVVSVHKTDGTAIARGLSNYSAAEIERIRGKRSQQIRELLQDEAYDEVIHRDNLVTVREDRVSDRDP